ncbi:MAG: helix-turn-helix domain containing protein [Actinomycetota bacterium]|nr:helix-turn-helix domain containing protein [Actinomycetota bacterium]
MPPDAATDSLEDLIAEPTVCIDGLEQALLRAKQLRDQRRSGQSWLDIVSTETHPLIVERITHALESLTTKGSRWRREQACALMAEEVSINHIAALFGVTPQRVSTLVRRRNGDVSAERPT